MIENKLISKLPINEIIKAICLSLFFHFLIITFIYFISFTYIKKNKVISYDVSLSYLDNNSFFNISKKQIINKNKGEHLINNVCTPEASKQKKKFKTDSSKHIIVDDQLLNKQFVLEETIKNDSFVNSNELIQDYKDIICQAINQNWSNYDKTSIAFYDLETIIKFHVLPDGEINNIKIVRKSGNELMDYLSYKAINEENFIQPHPIGINKLYVEITLSFTPDEDDEDANDRMGLDQDNTSIGVGPR